MKERINEQIEQSIKNGNHYLADCHFFPRKLGGGKYLEDLCNNHFQRTVNKMKRVHQLDDISPKEYNRLKNEISSLVDEINSLESKFKGDIHSLGRDIIGNLFSIPENDIRFHFKDENNFDRVEGNDLLASFKNDNDFDGYDSTTDYNEIETANRKIDSNRFKYSLICGGANDSMWSYKPFENAVEDINYKLPTLYDKFNAFNDFNVWVTPDEIFDEELGVDDDGFKIYNSYTDDNGYDIVINASNLPTMLHQMSKAIFSIFFKEKYNNKYLDYNNIWNVRLGYPIWKQMKKHITKKSQLPYIVSNIGGMDYKNFGDTMREMMAGTKKANQIFESLI